MIAINPTTTRELTLASLDNCFNSYQQPLNQQSTLLASLEALGFSASIETDGRVSLTIPVGWAIEDLSMPTGTMYHLVDQANHCRACYVDAGKPQFTFYSRYALEPYLGESIDQPEQPGCNRWCLVVRDNAEVPMEPGATLKFGRIVYTTASYIADDYLQDQAAQRACERWLRANQPEHKNPFAYWQ